MTPKAHMIFTGSPQIAKVTPKYAMPRLHQSEERLEKEDFANLGFESKAANRRGSRRIVRVGLSLLQTV